MTSFKFSRFFLLLTAALAACTAYTPKPLRLDDSRHALTARTLDEPQLAMRLRAIFPEQPIPPAAWNRAQLLIVATERNPGLREAQARLRASAAAMTTARALPNPTLGLTSEYDLSRAVESPWLWGVSLNFLLDAGVRRQLREQLANTQLRAARLDFAESLWTVRADLRKAMLSLLLSERRIAAQSAAIQLQEELLGAIQARVAVGEAASGEGLQVELELARAQKALAGARQQRTTAEAGVAAALGVPVAALREQRFAWEELETPYLPGEADFTHRRDQALLVRTDLERAVMDYEARDIELRQAIKQQYPQLSIGPGYTWDHGVRKATLGLSFSLPMLNRNQGPIAEAEAQREAAGEHVVVVQAAVLNEVDAAWAACQIALQTLQAARRQQAAAEAITEQARRALDLGSTDRVTWLGAQLTANVEALAVLDAVEVFQQALGDLENALRTPLSGPETNLTNILSAPEEQP